MLPDASRPRNQSGIDRHSFERARVRSPRPLLSPFFTLFCFEPLSLRVVRDQVHCLIARDEQTLRSLKHSTMQHNWLQAIALLQTFALSIYKLPEAVAIQYLVWFVYRLWARDSKEYFCVERP